MIVNETTVDKAKLDETRRTEALIARRETERVIEVNMVAWFLCIGYERNKDTIATVILYVVATKQ